MSQNTFPHGKQDPLKHQHVSQPHLSSSRPVLLQAQQPAIIHPAMFNQQASNVVIPQPATFSGYVSSGTLDPATSVVSAGGALPANYQLPVNVFTEERVHGDYPGYPGGAVDVAPRAPLLRNIPFAKPRNHFVSMAEQRNARFSQAHQPEKSVPHYPAAGAVAFSLHPRQPRNKTLQVSSQQHERLVLSPTPASWRAGLTWRNASSNFAPEALSWENSALSNKSVHASLSKRKERQQAYQTRRAAQKAKIEVLTQQVLLQRQKDIDNQFSSLDPRYRVNGEAWNWRGQPQPVPYVVAAQ